MARSLRRCICRAASVSVYIASLSLCLPVLSAGSEFSDDAASSRRYTLAGSLELSYDRYWSQGGAATTDDFRQTLLLDHHGFVADPKFVTYGLSGVVSHDSGKGVESSTLTGENLDVTLLHSLPDSWKKNEDFIPHPVWLRYSHDADSYFESTSYGFSFMHSVEPKQRYLVVEKATKAEGDDADLYEDAASMTSKIVEKERPFPIPRTFFDYDHYDNKIDGAHDMKDVLSLRSSLKGKTYDYSFLFEHQNETASYALNQNIIQLVPLYDFYNKEARQRIDIRSILRYEQINLGQTSELSSSVSLSRPIGKDALALTGILGYFGTSAPGQTAASYTAAASGAYTHQLSSRLTNNSQLMASFTKNNTVVTSPGVTNSNTVDTSTGLTNSNTVDTPAIFTKNAAVYSLYYVRSSDSVSADISRLYRGMASAYVGESSQGPEYGASATISTKTTITASLSYSYSLASSQVPTGTDPAQQGSTLPLQGSTAPLQGSKAPLQGSTLLLQQQVASGRIAQHNVTFSASGPLLNNLSFQTGANATLSEVPVVGGTAREETGTLFGNLLWRLPKTSVSVGGNYTQVKNVNAALSESSASTSLYSTLTRVLPMRMLFNLYTTWTKTTDTGVQNSESTNIEIKPSLRWTRGLTSVDTEYIYSRSMGTGAANSFFVRLVRKFSAGS